MALVNIVKDVGLMDYRVVEVGVNDKYIGVKSDWGSKNG